MGHHDKAILTHFPLSAFVAVWPGLFLKLILQMDGR